MRRLEFVSDHKPAVCLSIAAIALSLLASSENYYFELRPPFGGDSPVRWPLALDPLAYLTQDPSGQALLSKAEPAKNLVETYLPVGMESAVPPAASNELVVEAATKLKAGGITSCPTEKKYRVSFAGEANDPTALVCLDTGSLSVVEDGGISRVTFPMAMHPSYQTRPWGSFEASLAEATPEQCEAVTRPLVDYGQFLMTGTGILPPGTSANVEIVVGAGRQNPCDTWTPPPIGQTNPE